MTFFSRFKRGRLAPAADTRSMADGILLYAIGDIHGRDDLFSDLLDKIAADRRGRPHELCVLVLLGDLVDRGPDSDRVIERALSLPAHFDRVHHLIGNHEESMLAALAKDVRALRFFVRIGGEATIRSYLRDDKLYDRLTFEELADVFSDAVPRSHMDFLRRGEDMVRYGDYVFVHAGVRDSVPLDRQKLTDLRWIRDEFLSSKRDHGALIVHGHTIAAEVEERPNRIGIDTGAYRTGRLTAIGLYGTDRWYLQTP
ncbi:metallophosphoesterase [Sphingopyxis alaskensis RB2256]|uniref:Metallophosphoesterase n=2 Tax=Sphingopyxis alaskensis TaxID=117207 RepID=Q1GSS0_SPHAL|nr:metallophosphoesterase [Sphingopyxis alaskensis RB2256]